MCLRSCSRTLRPKSFAILLNAGVTVFGLTGAPFLLVNMKSSSRVEKLDNSLEDNWDS